jgi:hypothetical protein
MREKQLSRKRWVAYVRISDDKQEHGSENQEGTIRRFASKNGITLLAWYSDNTGTNPRDTGERRPEFNRMKRDAIAGKFDAVLVAYQKRLGLLGLAWGHWLFEFKNLGVSFWDCKGHNLSSEDPDTIRMTANDTAESMSWLMEHATKEKEASITSGETGRYHGGCPPFFCDKVCYDPSLTRIKWRMIYHSQTEKTQIFYDEDTGEEKLRRHFTDKQCPHKDDKDHLRLQPTIQPGRLEITRQIFEWFNNECVSFQQIARRLDKMGVSASYSQSWTTECIKSILLNPAAIGRPAQGKASQAKYANTAGEQEVVISSNKRGRCIKYEPKDWNMPEKPIFPPIVSEELFWAVREKMMSRRRGPKKPSRNSEAWLKGFLVCAGCGYPMYFHDRPIEDKNGTFMVKNKRYKKVPSYRCSSYQSRGGHTNRYGCQANFVKHSVAEELVLQYLTSTLQKTAFDAEVENRKPSFPLIERVPESFEEPDPQARERIVAEIAELKAKNREELELARKFGVESITEDAIAKVKSNDNKISELEEELKQQDERLTREEYDRRVNEALRTMKDGTDRAKKEALSKVLSKIELTFGYRESPSVKHHLAKVLFVPLVIQSRWDDTADKTKKNKQRQKELLEQSELLTAATAGNKDGPKMVAGVAHDYAGHASADNPQAFIYEGGRAWLASMPKQQAGVK